MPEHQNSRTQTWLTDEIHTVDFGRWLAHGMAQEDAARDLFANERLNPVRPSPLPLPVVDRAWMQDYRLELFDAMRACVDAPTPAKSDSLVRLLAHALRGRWTRVPHRPRGPLRRTMGRIQSAAERHAAYDRSTRDVPLDFPIEANVALVVSIMGCNRASALMALYEADGNVVDASMVCFISLLFFTETSMCP
jgi:hypothetical protein